MAQLGHAQHQEKRDPNNLYRRRTHMKSVVRRCCAMCLVRVLGVAVAVIAVTVVLGAIIVLKHAMH